MAPHPAPDLSTIAPGDRVAIRRPTGAPWERRYAWTTAAVQRVTPARITAGGKTYRRSDGMRLGDGGHREAAYLFPYHHPTVVAARHENAVDTARGIVSRACDAASTAARQGESVEFIRGRLTAALADLDRLEQLQAQGPHQ